MAVLRGGADGADKRFLIAGRVRPFVAPELVDGNAMDGMDRMDGSPHPFPLPGGEGERVDADVLFERARKRLGRPALAFAVVVDAIEHGRARDVLFTPEAVAAA